MTCGLQNKTVLVKYNSPVSNFEKASEGQIAIIKMHECQQHIFNVIESIL